MTTYTILIVTLICFLSSQLSLTHQANVSPHHHKHSGGEREVDGAFSPRDHSHFNGEEHDFDFDHEAILGSTKDAEEFDHLPPEEAKKRLAVLLLKMDSNGDKAITAAELKQWILRSFKSLSEEESKEKFDEADKDKDGKVTWAEYRAETYGVENEEESNIFSGKEHDEEQRLMKNDRELFDSADLNNDGQLDPKEFLSFTHPEEAPHMLDVILKQTLEEKDTNKNGFVDFKEYIGDRGTSIHFNLFCMLYKFDIFKIMVRFDSRVGQTERNV